MSEFEDRIAPYPNLWRSYTEALAAADEEKLSGDPLDYFLSKHCRVWFFESHLRVERELSDQAIRSVGDSPIIPFVLSNIQLKLLDRFEYRMTIGKKFRNRIMKCRRAQVSTLFLAISYHLARFNQNKKGLVFCDKLETSRKLRRILDIFYQGDSLIDRPDIGKKTLAEGLYFHPAGIDRNITDRDSFILLGSGEQANTGIGGSLDWMVWSEAALTPDAQTHWTTISPSMQGALFDVAESTPSMTGQDEIIFPEFEHPNPDCDRVFIPWTDVSAYRMDDEDKIVDFFPHADHHLYGKEIDIIAEHHVSVPQMLWRRFKLDELKNANAFRQVFPISEEEAFYSSAGLFFHKTLIESTKPKEKIVPKHHVFSDQGIAVSAVADETGLWKIYRSPMFTHNYAIIADIAEGKTADKDGRDPDYSVAMVFKLSNPVEEVAIIRERIPPEVLAEQVAAAGRYYNEAIVVPERNGPGLAFIVRIMQIYSNLYRHQKLQGGSFTTTQDHGFQTTSLTKVHALSCLLSQMRDKDKGLIIHSDVVRLEMAKFCQQGLKYGAMNGYHDDTISCLWILGALIFQTPHLLTSPVKSGEVGAVQPVAHFEPKISRPKQHAI